MPTFPFAETFAIVTRDVTGQDGDGNDVYGDVEVSVRGAFAPEGYTELIQGQDVVIANPTIFLEDGEPTPKPTDRMRVRGDVYEIDGKPLEYRNPFSGDRPGAVVRLEKVTG